MVFSSSKENRCIDLKLNGVEIKKVDSCRYLGVIIDNELNWSYHIDNIYNCLIKFVGIFYKMRFKLPVAVLRSMYFAFVHCHILYGIEVYANTFPTYLDKLIKLNNKLLRILQNQKRDCNVRNLYIKYDTLTIPELFNYHLLLLVHKIIHHSEILPSVFKDYFVQNSLIHAHETRLSSDIHLFRANTKFGHKSVSFNGGMLWNSLPQAFKTITSTSQFKKKIEISSHDPKLVMQLVLCNC